MIQPQDGEGGGAGNRDLGLCVLESRAYCLLYRKILLHMVPQASILHNKLQSVQYIYPFHSHSISLLTSVYANFLDLIFITSYHDYGALADEDGRKSSI
jgi:hypothetical protein